MTNLKSSRDSINKNEPTSVDFTVVYNGDKDAEVFLFKVIDTEYIPYTIGQENIQLKDDGNQNNGDLLQGDGTYSARILMEEDEEGSIELAAGVKDGEEWQYSNPINIFVIKELTEEETATAINTVEDTQLQLQQLISENKTTEEIKTEIVTILQEKEEVKQVDLSESGRSVWYALESGVLGAVTLEGDIQKNSQSQTHSIFNVSGKSLLSSNSDSKNLLGNLLVAIFSTHGNGEGNEINNLLNDSSIPFNVKHFKDNDVTVEEFKKMGQYGAIFFDTKGEALFKEDLKQYFPYLDKIYAAKEEKVVILTGEKMNISNTKKHSADLKTGRIITVDGYYAITSAFVEYYGKLQGKTMPNTFIYANTNQSLHNDAMAKEFINNGAQTYVGYKDTVVKGSMTKAISNMLNGDTVGKAVEGAGVLGNTNTIFAAPQDLINGSLEEELNGWVGAGHVDTITRLGNDQNPKWHTLRPTKGNRMGIVSSGVDKGALFGRQSWIYQTFTVPENVTNLKFDYNVVSSEPMVFINSRFDDKFKATIVPGEVKEPREDDEHSLFALSTESKGYRSPARDQYIKDFDKENIHNILSSNEYIKDDYKNDPYNSWVENTVDKDEVIIGFESINSSDWGQDFRDDRQRVDTVFPHGDETTYMTGWKTVSYDISPYQGKTISLKLQTWDLGDTAYPTAVLFDNVHLITSNYVGVGIEGRQEVQIPNSYDRPNNYFYQAGKVDQYGHISTGEIRVYEDDRGYIMPIRELTANIRLETPVQGVSLDEDTGVLTVTSEAEEGQITLVAYDDEGQEESLIVNLKAPILPKPSFINIDGEYDIYIKGDSEKEFTATVFDESYKPLDGYKVKWELWDLMKGITIGEDTGILSIKAEALQNIEAPIDVGIVAYLEEHNLYSNTYYIVINKLDDEEDHYLKNEVDRIIEELYDNKFADQAYPGYDFAEAYSLGSFVADKARELVKKEYGEKIHISAGNGYKDPVTGEHTKLDHGYYRVTVKTGNYIKTKDILVDTVTVETAQAFRDVLRYNIYKVKLDQDITINTEGWEENLLDKLEKILSNDEKYEKYQLIENGYSLTIEEQDQD